MRLAIMTIMGIGVLLSAGQAARAYSIDAPPLVQIQESQPLENQAVVAQFGTQQSIGPREQLLALGRGAVVSNQALPDTRAVSVPADVSRARQVAGELMESNSQVAPVNVGAVLAAAVLVLASVFGALWSMRRPTR